MEKLYWAEGSYDFPEKIRKAFQELGIKFPEDYEFNRTNLIYFGCSGENVSCTCKNSIDSAIVLACGTEVTFKDKDHNEKQMTLEEQFAKENDVDPLELKQARKAGFFPILTLSKQIFFVKYDEITYIDRDMDSSNTPRMHRRIQTRNNGFILTDESSADLIARMAEWVKLHKEE